LTQALSGLSQDKLQKLEESAYTIISVTDSTI